ncbi:YebW family protein [Dickeya fangzhongdai]|uniref:DUF1482 family protein n=1 Tax=Dickeya fangzhongdai TaxID=1778540 RepID=UPI001370F513|nr:DUF1482 family protein [Dickeya fangzhongdai]UMB78838.1 YebW family protein [Dickeya fangzhongdai]
MEGVLFALVISVCTLSGECDDAVLSVHDSEQECQHAIFEQGISGECYPVERIIRRADDQRPSK